MTDQLRARFENLELNAGLGKISAFISMALSLLCLFGALCFLFPSVLTTPELRPLYAKHYSLFYYGLITGIITLVLEHLVQSYDKIDMAFMVMFCTHSSSIRLWCYHAPVIPSVPFYAGIDYFVLTLVILAFIFIPLEGFLRKILNKRS